MADEIRLDYCEWCNGEGEFQGDPPIECGFCGGTGQAQEDDDE